MSKSLQGNVNKRTVLDIMLGTDRMLPSHEPAASVVKDFIGRIASERAQSSSVETCVVRWLQKRNERTKANSIASPVEPAITLGSDWTVPTFARIGRVKLCMAAGDDEGGEGCEWKEKEEMHRILLCRSKKRQMTQSL